MIYKVCESELMSARNEFGKPKWVINIVNDDSFKAGRCDAHTHGLDDVLGYELQFTLHLNPKIIGYILNSLGYLAVNGRKFAPGDTLNGLFENPELSVRFIEAEDIEGSSILRVLVGDKNNKCDETAEYPYNEQVLSPYKNSKIGGAIK